MGRPVRTAAVLLAALMAAACGQKQSALDDVAAENTRPRPAAEESRAELPEYFDDEPAEDTTAAPDVSGEAVPVPEAAPAPSGGAVVPVPGASASTGGPSPAAPARSSARQRPQPVDGPFGSGAPEDEAAVRAATGRPAPASGSPAPESKPSSSPPPAPSGSAEPGRAPVPEQPPTPPPAPRKAVEGPVDRTGVTKTTIKIGVHAPVTGAAPFPQRAFDQSKDLYWQYLKDQGGVFGRNVEIVFRDDEFNPASALQVCREMVEEEKVFALVGVAGGEQITACARYADSVGVPYFSGGVSEDGLAGLNLYFALSQTYTQQSPTIINLIQKKLKKTKIAVVVTDTPALNEIHRTFGVAALRAGLDIVRSSRVGTNASDSELLAEASRLKNSGADVVYVVMSPILFIKLATNAQAQAYQPTWVGPGTTNGLAVVAQAGCPSIGAAKFLSPFPQLDVIDELDPAYRPAFTKYTGGVADDVGILQWGLAKSVHQFLDATGADLSRQSFVSAITSGKTFSTNVYPDQRYDKSVRFGATSAHLLEADCSSRSWKTVGRFIADF